MLDKLFGKKEEISPIQVAQPTPEVFNANEEKQFKDPRTGEVVFQRSMTAEQRTQIFTAMKKNADAAQKLIGMSRQRLNIEKQLIKIEDEIVATEKEVNDIITKIRDDLKLSRQWGLNMQLGVLERRDPPNG